MNNEELLERELGGILALLKEAERNAVLNGRLCELKDLMAIHMAVLLGYDDMYEAVSFIKAVYSKEDES